MRKLLAIVTSAAVSSRRSCCRRTGCRRQYNDNVRYFRRRRRLPEQAGTSVKLWVWGRCYGADIAAGVAVRVAVIAINVGRKVELFLRGLVSGTHASGCSRRGSNRLMGVCPNGESLTSASVTGSTPPSSLNICLQRSGRLFPAETQVAGPGNQRQLIEGGRFGDADITARCLPVPVISSL